MSDKERNAELDAAEALKFKAEADEAAARARESEANTRRTDAEIDKMTHESRKARIEADSAEINLVEKQRTHAESQSADKYHHIFFFTSEVKAASVKECMNQLNQWRRLHKESGDKPDIEICFSSPGGSVIDGMALFDFIQSVRRDGHRVTTSTIGYAASMAGILLQAGDVRVMGAESYLLIHEISFGAGGKIGEVEDEVAFVRKVQGRVLDIFAARSLQAKKNGTATKSLTKKQIDSRWKRKDWWLSADESLELGFVDRIA
jgi:ATP-dependent Clp endopeptidase proteolytic subunit ClpP